MDFEAKTTAIATEARAIKITDQGALDHASGFLTGIKTLRKEIKDTFGPVIKKAHDAHKEALAQQKRYEQPLIDGEKIVKAEMAKYIEEQERIRREAEAKVERERQEAERKKREEEERALAEAAKAEEEGDAEKAAAIVEEAAEKAAEPIAAPAAVIPEAPTMAPEVHTKKVWRWEIENDTAVPREYCSPDRRKIEAALKATQYATKIQGIRVFQETVVAARSASR